MTGSSALLPLIEKYFEKDPITAARHLETLEESEVLQIIQTVPAPLAARIAEYVPPAIAAILLPQLPKSMAKAIIDKLKTQRATTILLDMPPDTRQNFIEFLSDKKKHQIQDMLSFPERYDVYG